MGGYYDIKIIEINRAEASVKMRIRMFNYDAGKIYDSVGFGLQLLENGKWKGSLIGEEISFEDLLDPEWCQKYANGFVKSVEKVEQSSDPPIAILTIYCTDSAWTSHLLVGEEWESYAYEVAQKYDACEPILYQKVEGSNADSDESIGWMPVPSFLYAQGTHRLPNVVLIPKFTESSYYIKDTLRFTQENQHELLKLHGKYIKDLKTKHAGIFTWNDSAERYEIQFIGRGTRNGDYYGKYGSFEFPEEVGLFALKPNFKRHHPFLTYFELFKMTNPVIKSAQRTRNSVALEVTGIYDIDKLELNKAKILKLLNSNFIDTYGYVGETDSEFPLSRLLKYFAQKDSQNDLDIVLPKVANGIILDYSYEYPSKLLEDYDSMDFKSLVAYFEKEQWPCFKFNIELSDEVFGVQLEKAIQTVRPIVLNFVSSDIEHWEQPILWKDYQHLVDQ
ncbi:MAG: hypothetical protein AAGG68_23000 [Bacteroidota bacterium]